MSKIKLIDFQRIIIIIDIIIQYNLATPCICHTVEIRNTLCISVVMLCFQYSNDLSLSVGNYIVRLGSPRDYSGTKGSPDTNISHNTHYSRRRKNRTNS